MPAGPQRDARARRSAAARLDGPAATPARTYKFIGTAAQGLGLDLSTVDYTDALLWQLVGRPIDLGTENYADTTRWAPRAIVGDDARVPRRPRPRTSPRPTRWRSARSSSCNDVRGGVSSEITNQTVTAGGGVAVTALEDGRRSTRPTSSSVVSDGGSPFDRRRLDGRGQRPARHEPRAQRRRGDDHDSTVTTTAGDVTVDAQNTSAITAEITSKTTSKGISVGVTLAFNTIGWDSQNILFNFADAIARARHRRRGPGEDDRRRSPARRSAPAARSRSRPTSHASIDATIHTSAIAIKAPLEERRAYAVADRRRSSR